MNKVILITGVSSGFGKSTAKILANTGHKVYGTVRRDPEPEDPAFTMKMNLTDHESVKKVVKDILEKEGRIDVLINNAGMHTGGPAETSSASNIVLQIGTNFTGMVHLIQEVLPIMRRQGGGTIINFSSIGGLMGLPFQSYYSASKFAIEGFSEALRMEVKNFNIKVIVINPGDFHTSNSVNRRKFLAPSQEGDPYFDQFNKTLTIIERDERIGWPPEILAERVAQIIGYKNPRQRYIIASFEQKLAVLLKYLLPAKWFSKIIESHYEIS